MALWPHAFRSGVLLVLLCVFVPLPLAAEARDRAAMPSDLAAKRLLTAVARAGDRLVAVGEHGHVVLSDDSGRTWRQARRVPTRLLLTAVTFVDAMHGWAGGHDAVILATRDGGETWEHQFAAPDREAPILGLHFRDARNGLAVGAFALVLETGDGGQTWRRRPLAEGGALEPGADATVPRDGHLNGAFALADGTRLLPAEFGQVFRAGPDTPWFSSVQTDYEGSLWGGLVTPSGAALAFGMRGTVLRSEDDGQSWQSVSLDSRQSLTGGTRTADGRLVLVGLSGTMAISRDDGRRFTVTSRPDRQNLTDVIEAPDGTLIVVGEDGAARRGPGATAP